MITIRLNNETIMHCQNTGLIHGPHHSIVTKTFTGANDGHEKYLLVSILGINVVIMIWCPSRFYANLLLK